MFVCVCNVCTCVCECKNYKFEDITLQKKKSTKYRPCQSKVVLVKRGLKCIEIFTYETLSFQIFNTLMKTIFIHYTFGSVLLVSPLSLFSVDLFFSNSF